MDGFPTYPVDNGDNGIPSALDVATRVELQEQLANTLASEVSEEIRKRVDSQEAQLKPVYRTLVKDIQQRVNGQAALTTPVVTRVRNGINSRIVTNGAALSNVIDVVPSAFGDLIDERGINATAATTPITSPVYTPTPPPPTTLFPNPPPLRPIEGPCPPNAREFVPVDENGNCPPGFLHHHMFPQLCVISCEHPCHPLYKGITCTEPDPTSPPPTSPPASPPPASPPLVPPPALPSEPSSCPVVSSCPAPVINLSCPAPAPPATTGEPTKPKDEPPAGSEEPATPAIPDLPFVHMDWCVPNPCSRADTVISEIRSRLPVTSEADTPDFSTPMLAVMQHSASVALNGLLDSAKRFIPGNMAEHVSLGAGEAIGRVVVGTSTAGLIMKDLKLAGIRNEPVAATLMARIGSATLAETETGLPFSYILNTDRYLFQYSNPQYIPSQSEIDSAWLHGHITDTQWECWTRANGNIPSCRLPVLQSQARMPDVLEIISLFRRGLLGTKAELIEQMRRLGVTTVGDVDKWLAATQQLPTPSDLTHMAIRDAFDPNKLGRAEILAEFREQRGMIELFEAQGYGNFTIRTVDGRTLTYNAAELVWLSSYEEASPTQTYEFQHRLRPNRVHMYEQFIPGKSPAELRTILPGANLRPSPDGSGTIVTPKPHTLYETAKNLKEKDYNPIWRDKLAAISYRVIGRIDLRRFYKLGLFGKPVGTKGFIGTPETGFTPKEAAEVELVERYMDEGYNRTDATLHAYYTAADYERVATNKQRTRALNNLCKAFQLGVLDQIDTHNEILKITNDLEETRTRVEQCKLEHRMRVVTKTIAGIRRRFLNLEFDDNEARRLLTVAGVDRVRINELLQLWNVELDGKDKDASVNMLCAWYNQGSITRGEFKQRLRRLKFGEGDVERIVKHCELGELARVSKVKERIARANKREQERLLSQAERERKEAEKARQREIARFLSFRSEKNLKEWLLAGEITPAQVIDTFILKGASRDDAERWVRVTTGKAASSGSGSENKP